MNNETNELTIQLESFEGPLDLLLHLIKELKVDIFDIPMVEITNQYFHYLHYHKLNIIYNLMNIYPHHHDNNILYQF